MTTTRANLELILISRAGAWMTNAGLDGTTVNGTNAALNDALGYAIRAAGGTVAAPAIVTSTDVLTVADSDLDKLLDLAELRALENTLSNFALVDAKAGPVEAKSSQFADRLERRIDQIRARLAVLYGIGAASAFSVALRRSDAYTALEDELST